LSVLLNTAEQTRQPYRIDQWRGQWGNSMTENAWLAVNNPESMLELLRDHKSERKLRLLGCAVCDLHKPDPNNTEVAVQFADGSATLEQLRTVWGTTEARPWSWPERGHAWASRLLPPAPDHDIRDFIPNIIDKATMLRVGFLLTIRDIFGNPFRPVTLDSRWQTETVVALAAGIYAERAFDRMPILADALEDAGCDHADILTHCRSDGPHVRGCWVVDLLLGKS